MQCLPMNMYRARMVTLTEPIRSALSIPLISLREDIEWKKAQRNAEVVQAFLPLYFNAD